MVYPLGLDIDGYIVNDNAYNLSSFSWKRGHLQIQKGPPGVKRGQYRSVYMSQQYKAHAKATPPEAIRTTSIGALSR